MLAIQEKREFGGNRKFQRKLPVRMWAILLNKFTRLETVCRNGPRKVTKILKDPGTNALLDIGKQLSIPT